MWERKEDTKKKQINKTNLSLYLYSLVRYKELVSFVLLSKEKDGDEERVCVATHWTAN